MRSVRLAAPILVAALAVSCGERSTVPTGSSPAFDFTNGPASPGNSGIFRFQDGQFEIAVDVNAGLMSVHGLQNTIADLCRGLGQFDLMDFQVRPHRAGEVEALIVDQTSSVQIFPLGPASCAYLSGAPVLYRGTAALHRTDNNYTPTGSEGGRANSFGWAAQGVLDDLVSGGLVSYSEEVRFVLNPQTGALTVAISNINVH